MNASGTTNILARLLLAAAIVLGSVAFATAAAPMDPTRAFAALSTAPVHGVTPLRHTAENPSAVASEQIGRLHADGESRVVAAYGAGILADLLGVLSIPLRI